MDTLNVECLIKAAKAGYVSGQLVRNTDGVVVETFEQHVQGHTKNLIVERASIAMAYTLKTLCNLAYNASPSRPMLYMAVGTGTVAADDTDTVLGTEVARINVTGGVTFTTDGPGTTLSMTLNGSTVTNKVKVEGVFDASVVGALTEAGLFFGEDCSNDDEGILFNRKVFSPWNKTADFSLLLIWVLVF
jgi:hypothetical protein